MSEFTEQAKKLCDMLSEEDKAALSQVPAPCACSVPLRYENLRLRSALRDMLREAESDLRNNDGNPYRAVVLRAQAALNISTPNARHDAGGRSGANDD